MIDLPEPWRPMSDAPRDGSDIVALYCDLSGVEVVFWGKVPPGQWDEIQIQDDPEGYDRGRGWLVYTGAVGDTSDAQYYGEPWAGWVQFPNQSTLRPPRPAPASRPGGAAT
jgi:hypothetical protein